MNTTELIKKHETSIKLLELIEAAEYNYRSHCANRSTFKRAGMLLLSEKFDHRAEIARMAIERLTERYQCIYAQLLEAN